MTAFWTYEHDIRQTAHYCAKWTKLFLQAIRISKSPVNCPRNQDVNSTGSGCNTGRQILRSGNHRCKKFVQPWKIEKRQILHSGNLRCKKICSTRGKLKKVVEALGKSAGGVMKTATWQGIARKTLNACWTSMQILMTTTMPQKGKSAHGRRNEACSDKLQPLWGHARSSGPVSATRERQRSMGHRQKWEKRNLNEMKITIRRVCRS